ncbi:MAG: DUF1573 domain-containing protein [Planctomycetaceae bacterium]|nr:DUF1573 domain-containing protein [Planctomycetaceae bacterium]
MTLHVFAQSWAEMMFEERRHDFGSVAIGVEAVYRFQLKNIYSDDVHIASVHSSCGCTSPSVTKAWIRGGETSEIVAKLNTDGRFEKNKSATLTVVFDKPYLAEVQLQVTSYIRPDVVINPGVAEFGSIAEGKKASTKLIMQYAGRNDWQLVKIERNNPAIHVRADEMERGNGRVSYEITITLQENIRPGYVLDMIRFVTNDPNPEASSVMLPVHGYVTAPLIAKPSPLTIGILKPGETVTKNIVLRSATPFKIKRAASGDKRFRFSISEQENKVHVVPITFTAGENTGDLTEPIIVQTDLDAQQEIVILTQGRVLSEHTQNFPKEMIATQTERRNSEPKSLSARQNDQVDHQSNNKPVADVSMTDVPNIGRSPALRESRPLPKTEKRQELSDQADAFSESPLKVQAEKVQTDVPLQSRNTDVTLPKQTTLSEQISPEQKTERPVKKLTSPAETNSGLTNSASSSRDDLEISFDSVSVMETKRSDSDKNTDAQNNSGLGAQDGFFVDVSSQVDVSPKKRINAATPLSLQDTAFETISPGAASPGAASPEAVLPQRMLPPNTTPPPGLQESVTRPAQQQMTVSDSLFTESSPESASIERSSVQPQKLRFSTPTFRADVATGTNTTETTGVTEKFSTDVFTVVGEQKELQSPASSTPRAIKGVLPSTVSKTAAANGYNIDGNKADAPKIAMVPPVPGMKPVPNSVFSQGVSSQTASSQNSLLQNASQNSSPSPGMPELTLQPTKNATDLLASLTGDTPETPAAVSQKNETSDTSGTHQQLPKLLRMPSPQPSLQEQEIPEDSLKQDFMTPEDGYALTTKKESTEYEEALQVETPPNGSSASQEMSPVKSMTPQQNRSQKNGSQQPLRTLTSQSPRTAGTLTPQTLSRMMPSNDSPQPIMPPATTSSTTTATPNRPNAAPRIAAAPRFGMPATQQQSTANQTANQSVGTQTSSQQKSVLPQRSPGTTTGASAGRPVKTTQPSLVAPAPAWQDYASSLR